MMEPSVSVPIVTAAMFAAAAIAEPLLEEHGVADGTYGFCIGNQKSISIRVQHLVLGVAPKRQRNEPRKGTDLALTATWAPSGGDAGATEVAPLAEASGTEEHRAGVPEPLDNAGVARGA